VLTRLLYLLEYVSVVFFFNVFSMPQKTAFGGASGLLVKRWIRVLVCLWFPKGKRTKHGALNPFMPARVC